MGLMLGFLIRCAITAAILSAIPMVKSKGFGYSMAVAAIMSVIQTILILVAIPAWFAGALMTIIPFFGGMLAHISFFLTALIINTLSLYVADQAVDGFKIDSIGETAMTAVILAFCQSIVGIFI